MRFEFELTNAAATLSNLNPRVEKKGGNKEKVPAADLHFSCVQSADVLAFFSPTLKSFVFDEKGPRDLADGLPLRDPHMVYPLSRDEELLNATVKLDYGVKAPMEFEDAKVNRFEITPMEGGSVKVGFRVQCKPDEKQIGKLYLLQEQSVTLSIEPGELPEMKENAA
jgi:hypothetical protein